MTAQTLPKKLNKGPLADAVFEIRFSSSTPASSILPGLFFAKVEEPAEWRSESLPVSEIPSQFRNADPNLRYQPLMRLHWNNFIILISDTALGVQFKTPYPGWIQFKEQIIKAINILIGTKIVQNIERYSIKYVDIIEGKDLAEQIQRINMDIRIGSHTLKEEPFTVRVEIRQDSFINIIQIAGPVTGQITEGEFHGQIRRGVLVDTDTICNYQTNNLIQFTNELPNRLDEIHLENKKMFFECLTQDTVTYLEPVYE